MKALLITTTDLKRYSILNGNVDNDKFIQYISIAQDIHLKNYLGTKLLEKLESLIPTDIDLVGNAKYKTLLNNYIKPMLIHWSLVEYLPFAAYQIANSGVIKHKTETSETVNKNEIDFLVEKQRNTAESYTKRFVDFMCYNYTNYPEYTSNVNNDVKPSKSSDFTGWVL